MASYLTLEQSVLTPRATANAVISDDYAILESYRSNEYPHIDPSYISCDDAHVTTFVLFVIEAEGR
jgi:hypothetical protein